MARRSADPPIRPCRGRERRDHVRDVRRHDRRRRASRRAACCKHQLAPMMCVSAGSPRPSPRPRRSTSLRRHRAAPSPASPRCPPRRRRCPGGPRCEHQPSRRPCPRGRRWWWRRRCRGCGPLTCSMVSSPHGDVRDSFGSGGVQLPFAVTVDLSRRRSTPLKSSCVVAAWPRPLSLPSPGYHWEVVVAAAEISGVGADVAVDVVVAFAGDECVCSVAAADGVVAVAAVEGE